MQRPPLAIRAGAQAPDRSITSAWLPVSSLAAKPSSLSQFLFSYGNYPMNIGETGLRIRWHLHGTEHADQGCGNTTTGAGGNAGRRTIGLVFGLMTHFLPFLGTENAS